jgi:uncharacterized membrane-anchored protein
MVTIWFWLIRVMLAGAGVAWPDYVYQHLGQVVASGVICAALIAALAAQFRAQCYRAWFFWPAIAMISVAGTEAANGLHVKLGLPYFAVALLYLVLLIALLVWWRSREGTLSLRMIDSMPREAFFWAAALAAYALGTAIVHLSGVVVPGGLAGLWTWVAVTGCVAVAWRWFGLGPVLAFWSCYVLTRPLGTSIALRLAAGRGEGGLGLGLWPVSAGLAVGVVIMVTYLAVSHSDALAPGIAAVPP